MNHQRENGHIDIANTLMEKLMKIHLSGNEWRIIMAIIRQTWGYCELKNGEKHKDKHGFWVKKKIDMISHTRFEELTKIKRRKVWGILNKLLAKNMIIKTITKRGDSIVCNYGIQKDSDKWILLSPKEVTVPQRGDRVSPKEVTVLSPKEVHIKETLKENIKKKTISRPSFDKEGVVYQLVIYLDGKIRENNEAENRKSKKTEPQLQSWCIDMDKLLRIDKADPNEVKKIIDWVVDDNFWAKNVLCPASLRKQYPRFYKQVIDRGRSLEDYNWENDPTMEFLKNEKEGE